MGFHIGNLRNIIKERILKNIVLSISTSNFLILIKVQRQDAAYPIIIPKKKKKPANGSSFIQGIRGKKKKTRRKGVGQE